MPLTMEVSYDGDAKGILFEHARERGGAMKTIAMTCLLILRFRFFCTVTSQPGAVPEDKQLEKFSRIGKSDKKQSNAFAT